MLVFILSVAGAAASLVALLHLGRGGSLLPVDPRPASPRRDPAQVRRLATGLAVGLAILLVTRWPAAAVAAGALAVLWPRVFGGAAAGRRELRKIEAIAVWTESLRDTSAAASGLEQAIPATVQSAPDLLRKPLRDLSARLAGRVPLPEALARFADDLDDPAGDMVVAALSLNARQRAGGLQRILTALATSARSELEMRRKVEHERRALRGQAQKIAGLVVGFVVLQAVFARSWVEPYSSPAGQLALSVFIAIFLAAFMRMRSLANTQPPARFLTSADAVTEVASYKPVAGSARWGQ
ncbi:type II secretion system F family protein [Nocardioides pakistanensis]